MGVQAPLELRPRFWEETTLEPVRDNLVAVKRCSSYE